MVAASRSARRFVDGDREHGAIASRKPQAAARTTQRTRARNLVIVARAA
jgi:hypothetical protein